MNVNLSLNDPPNLAGHSTIWVNATCKVVSVNDFFYKINLIEDFKHNRRSTYVYKDTCVVLYSHIWKFKRREALLCQWIAEPMSVLSRVKS